MDLITQIQGNLKAVSASLTNTVGYLNNQSPSVPSEYTDDHIPLQRINQQADELIQLLIQTDLLITSLPQKFETEQEQLETIQQLSEQHQLAGKRLDQAREEAKIWKEKLSQTIQQIAHEQFKAHDVEY